MHGVCEGAWFALYLHVVFKTSFLVTGALFRVLCSGVSVSTFGLCVKCVETVLRLIVLVVAVTAGPGCERLVRFVVLVIEFSRAWGISCSFIVYSGLFSVIGTVGRIGRYCYRWHYSSVEILDVFDCTVVTYYLGRIFYCLYCLF